MSRLMPAHAGLEDRRQAVQDAQQRVADAEAEGKASTQRAERANAPLLDYYRGLGRGESEDPELEQRLKAELSEAQRGLTMRPAQFPFGNGRYEVKLVAADAAAEARLDGAREALRDAEGWLKGYITEHLAALAAERAPQAQAIEQAATEALKQARRVAGEWERERAWWAGICSLTEREALLATIPQNPLAWTQESPRTGSLPMPEAFVR